MRAPRFAALPPRVRALVPELAAFALTTLVVFALFWPASGDLGATLPRTPFGDSHVWGFDLVLRMARGAEPLVPTTGRAGFPLLRGAPVLAWAPALLSGLLRPAFDPVTAFELVWFAAPGFAAATFAAWVRRRNGTPGPTAAALGFAWALSPPLLATMAAGNVDQAQVWVYPAWLWAATAAVDGSAAAALIAAGVGAAAAFTEPYLGLFLPLFGTPVVLLHAGRDRKRLVRAFGALALTAAAMAPASLWFGGAHDRFTPQVFAPASAPVPGITAIPHGEAPSADPSALFVPPGELDWAWPVHVVYVGIPMLLAAAGAAFGSTTRRGALVVVGVGVVVVLGPQLIRDDHWQAWHGHPAWLPVALLEALGYPTARGGQYYRAAPIVGLGLAWLVAGAGWRRGTAVLAALSFADAWAATRGAWPREVRRVDGRPACAVIAASTEAGAVLSLPLTGTQAEGGEKLALAALHGRATSALPMHMPPKMIPDQTPWLDHWRGTTVTRGFYARTGAIETLRSAGFVWVLYSPGSEADGPELQPATLTRLLGLPVLATGGTLLWAVPEPPPAYTPLPAPGR